MDASIALVIATSFLTVVDKLLAVLAIQKQNAELTPEQEAAFDELERQRRSMGHWLPSR